MYGIVRRKYPFCERSKREGRKGKLEFECPNYRKKNRDTGGMTCMELYVGNTPQMSNFCSGMCVLCAFVAWGRG
jgi:hypothetical protein